MPSFPENSRYIYSFPPMIFFSPKALDPIIYHVSLVSGIGTEVFAVALYTVLFLVIPEILSVNRLSKNWLSVFVVPCFFVTPFADSERSTCYFIILTRSYS